MHITSYSSCWCLAHYRSSTGKQIFFIQVKKLFSSVLWRCSVMILSGSILYMCAVARGNRLHSTYWGKCYEDGQSMSYSKNIYVSTNSHTIAQTWFFQRKWWTDCWWLRYNVCKKSSSYQDWVSSCSWIPARNFLVHLSCGQMTLKIFQWKPVNTLTEVICMHGFIL